MRLYVYHISFLIGRNTNAKPGVQLGKEQIKLRLLTVQYWNTGKTKMGVSQEKEERH